MNTTLTTHRRIAAVETDLRDLYNNTNEGPRLVAELVERLRDERFPFPPGSSDEYLQDEVEERDDTIRELEAEVKSLENLVAELREELES